MAITINGTANTVAGIAAGGINDNVVDNGTMANNAIDSAELAAGAVDLAHLSATGTASSSTFLRGDNAWAAAGGGKFLQIVGSVYTSNVSYNSTSTYADTGLTVDITTSASGHAGVLALVAGGLGGIGNTSGGESASVMNLVRGSTELAEVNSGGWGGNVSGNRVSNHNSNSLIFYDTGTSASTTYTYKVQFKKTSDCVQAFWNNYNGKSYIYLIEVGS